MYISSQRPAAGAVPKIPQSSAGVTLSADAPEAHSGAPVVPPEEYMRQAERFVDDLKAKFGADFRGGEGKEPLIVSDIIDDAGHQYVNLVQKGGGVLGIALVGYTYVLEQAGIRFVRMAGTSAGAINTALFTAIGDKANPKAEAKSGRLLAYLSRLEMFSFVDGHPFAKWMIRNFISDKNFSKRITKVLAGLAIIQLLLIVASFLLLGLEKVWDWEYDSALTRVSFVATGLCFLLVLSLASYSSRMFSRLRNSGYGINPGDAFLSWIKDRLDENDAGTIEDLERKASTLPADLKMRDGRPLGTLEADVTFITSELVTQNKIEFPKMWNLFRDPDKKGELHPGEFVRASMSIPFFFESHIISKIPTQNKEVQKAWEDTFACKAERVPNVARFVDGGVLSNFPINIFYNPAVAEARLPSFGIDLDDTDPKGDRGDDAASWAIGSYCMRMLNTIRYYYDKDFLLKNAVFARGVGSVKLHDKKFNWLDFFLSDKTKMELFLKGAEAARDFLLEFNWEKYKEERRKMHQQIHPESVAPVPSEPPIAIVSNPATMLTPPVS
jgi:NTE family protein